MHACKRARGAGLGLHSSGRIGANWRRRRDSNPGRSSTPRNRLAGGSFRPLRHVSVAESTVAPRAARPLSPRADTGCRSASRTVRLGLRVAHIGLAPGVPVVTVRRPLDVLTLRPVLQLGIRVLQTLRRLHRSTRDAFSGDSADATSIGACSGNEPRPGRSSWERCSARSFRGVPARTTRTRRRHRPHRTPGRRRNGPRTRRSPRARRPRRHPRRSRGSSTPRTSIPKVPTSTGGCR